MVLECERIKIKDLSELLGRIAINEGLEASKSQLLSIAAKANGDIRAAINDLQTCVDEKVIDVSLLESRDQEETILNALKIIFKTSDVSLSLRALDNVDLDLDECFMFLEENIPHEYGEVRDIASAFRVLARADVFRGRILRRQYWRFLVYQNSFMTAGVSSAKVKVYAGFYQYRRSMRPLRIWQANMRLQKKRSIGEKLARLTRRSVKKTLKTFSLYKPLLINAEKELNLSEEEIIYLRK